MKIVKLIAMRAAFGVLIITLFLSYTYYESLDDIFQNFGVYFPFIKISTYSDLVKHVLLPRFEIDDNGRLFSIDELKRCNGEEDVRLYLSILGQVFDVSAGSAYYGAGKMYHKFTGTHIQLYRCKWLECDSLLRC